MGAHPLYIFFMKRFSTLFLYIALFAGLYFFQVSFQGREMKDLPGVTDASQVADIIIPADENPGLGFDVKGFMKDGQYILFLPVRADKSSLALYLLDAQGAPLELVTHDFEAQEELLIAGSLTVRVMQSDLPSLEINLSGDDLCEVEASKDQTYVAGGDMVLSCSDDYADEHGCETVFKTRDSNWDINGSLTLWGHGNASWLLDKKSYDLKLESLPAILDMGESDRWVLLANAIDYTLLRNQVFYELAGDCGLAFTPLLRHVDLFIDGEYRGCYTMCQKVKAGSDMIDMNPGRDFLYKWGLPGENAHQLPRMIFRDKLTNVVELKETGDPSKAEEALDIAFRLVDAIADTSSDGYLEMVDLPGWARYYWIQEFAKNTDATSRSLYTVWLGDERKMIMSPIWDMDQTAGVQEPFDRPADYIYPTEWAVRCEEWYVPLFEHKSFSDEVERIYRDEDLGEKFVKCAAEIPEKARAIRKSAEMNFTRWDVLEEPQNNQIVRYMGESTIDTQVEWLSEWCRQRAEWIAQEMK